MNLSTLQRHLSIVTECKSWKLFTWWNFNIFFGYAISNCNFRIYLYTLWSIKWYILFVAIKLSHSVVFSFTTSSNCCLKYVTIIYKQYYTIVPAMYGIIIWSSRKLSTFIHSLNGMGKWCTCMVLFFFFLNWNTAYIFACYWWTVSYIKWVKSFMHKNIYLEIEDTQRRCGNDYA